MDQKTTYSYQRTPGLDCPKCGGVIEVFIRDGQTVGESICDQCGFAIPGDVHLSLYLEEVAK